MKNIIFIILCFTFAFKTIKAQDNNVKNKKIEVNNNDYSELFNWQLIGLGYDETKDNFYDKYFIEFVTLCYGGTDAFYIDTTKQKFYVFNYDGTQEGNNQTTFNNNIIDTFNIDSIVSNESNCCIYTTQILNNNSIDKIPRRLLFTFSKFEHEVFLLKIYENGKELQKENLSRHTYIINEKHKSKFAFEECGDFEG